MIDPAYLVRLGLAKDDRGESLPHTPPNTPNTHTCTTQQTINVRRHPSVREESSETAYDAQKRWTDLPYTVPTSANKVFCTYRLVERILKFLPACQAATLRRLNHICMRVIQDGNIFAQARDEIFDVLLDLQYYVSRGRLAKTSVGTQHAASSSLISPGEQTMNDNPSACVAKSTAVESMNAELAKLKAILALSDTQSRRYKDVLAFVAAASEPPACPPDNESSASHLIRQAEQTSTLPMADHAAASDVIDMAQQPGSAADTPLRNHEAGSQLASSSALRSVDSTADTTSIGASDSESRQCTKELGGQESRFQRATTESESSIARKIPAAVPEAIVISDSPPSQAVTSMWEGIKTENDSHFLGETLDGASNARSTIDRENHTTVESVEDTEDEEEIDHQLQVIALRCEVKEDQLRQLELKRKRRLIMKRKMDTKRVKME